MRWHERKRPVLLRSRCCPVPAVPTLRLLRRRPPASPADPWPSPAQLTCPAVPLCSRPGQTQERARQPAGALLHSVVALAPLLSKAVGRLLLARAWPCPAHCAGSFALMAAASLQPTCAPVAVAPMARRTTRPRSARAQPILGETPRRPGHPDSQCADLAGTGSRQRPRLPPWVQGLLPEVVQARGRRRSAWPLNRPSLPTG
mmetsp:Transcript_128788/g.358567  ORF Transcript_128788/g.358567 Transcript_128788/m.358567 type:complete len:202 (-) Transcript_128788:60-665(-)